MESFIGLVIATPKKSWLLKKSNWKTRTRECRPQPCVKFPFSKNFSHIPTS